MQMRRRVRKLEVKRIYEPSESSDGYRVLVDRVWPRGLSKQNADIHLWLKDIAPSTELRQWFGHQPRRWDAFRRRYFDELDEMPETLAVIQDKLRKDDVTLVYSARDEAHNQAVALREYLLKDAKR